MFTSPFTIRDHNTSFIESIYHPPGDGKPLLSWTHIKRNLCPLADNFDSTWWRANPNPFEIDSTPLVPRTTLFNCAPRQCPDSVKLYTRFNSQQFIIKVTLFAGPDIKCGGGRDQWTKRRWKGRRNLVIDLGALYRKLIRSFYIIQQRSFPSQDFYSDSPPIIHQPTHFSACPSIRQLTLPIGFIQWTFINCSSISLRCNHDPVPVDRIDERVSSSILWPHWLTGYRI